MITIAQRMRDVRTCVNLTQKDFAKLIGSTERGVQRYEAGERKPAYDVLLAILQNIDISADYLLGLTDNPKGSRYDDTH